MLDKLDRQYWRRVDAIFGEMRRADDRRRAAQCRGDAQSILRLDARELTLLNDLGIAMAPLVSMCRCIIPTEKLHEKP